VEITLRVPTGPARVGWVGAGERNLKMIREALGVNVTARHGMVRLSGEPDAVVVARNVIERLARERPGSSRQEVLDVIADESARRLAREGRNGARPAPTWGGVDEPGLIDDPSRIASRGEDGSAWQGDLAVYAGGRRIAPKTINQRAYLEAIRTSDLVFGIGPAGTGKTYLAVAAAVHMMKIGAISKLILVRPAVEAGEKLGFLPGDIQAKVNPYLRPLHDALHDMMDYPTIRRFMEHDIVEVIPLAFMRGRTLNNAAIILDEAQNTTRGQMKMFLTRLGHGSKMIVTGDATQIDLEDPTQSGLIDAARRLRRVRGVGFVTLDKEDVVRHTLVQRVIEAYGEDETSGAYAHMLERAMRENGHDRTDGAS
jgi:phosphate starvation-inducible PhoH-like protein